MRKIAAGSFSASISERGELFIWGTGIFGEFLTPHRVKTINGDTIDVDIGNHIGAAVNRDGQVYSWGHNSNGELGQCDFDERPTPLLLQSLNDRKVTSIKCGRNFMIALGQTLKFGDTGVFRRPNSPLKNEYIYKKTNDKFNISAERHSIPQSAIRNNSK